MSREVHAPIGRAVEPVDASVLDGDVAQDATTDLSRVMESFVEMADDMVGVDLETSVNGELLGIELGEFEEEFCAGGERAAAEFLSDDGIERTKSGMVEEEKFGAMLD